MVALAALALVLGVPADAAIRPTASAAELAAAMAVNPASVTGASFVTRPGGLPTAVSDTPLTGFPNNGPTYTILSTGDATAAERPNTNVPDNATTGLDDQSAMNGGGHVRGDSDFDVVILKVDVSVPTGANCLSLDLRFLTEEYVEFVGQRYNDGFIAELDTSNWSIAGSTITAPRNFAFDPLGQVISVNAAGTTSVNAENAAGTTYDGATPLLHASTPITPGAHSLYLSIFDAGDDELDSTVFLDNLAVGSVPAAQCRPGARVGAPGPPPVGVGPVTGTVVVRLPGTNQFVPLPSNAQVPIGTTVDATQGTVQLAAPGGSAVFYEGAFGVFRGTERVNRRTRTLVELRLALGDFTVCGRRALSQGRDRPVRRLWGKGKGRFRTRGRHAAATVRGTTWLMEDRCGGTFTRVRVGRVQVRDLVRNRTVNLRAGQSYFARSRR